MNWLMGEAPFPAANCTVKKSLPVKEEFNINQTKLLKISWLSLIVLINGFPVVLCLLPAKQASKEVFGKASNLTLSPVDTPVKFIQAEPFSFVVVENCCSSEGRTRC
jgi:hypothetical protein